MVNALSCLLKRKVTEDPLIRDDDIEQIGRDIRREIDAVFGRSLAIRELDTGSDNATEIEINNLNNPYYDIERFGITFVASPRHADVLVVTGAVTHNMAGAARKTYEAMPSPKFVVAVGDDACDGGIFNSTYAVLGGAEMVFPVDLKIPGNPPTPKDILTGLLALMKHAGKTR
ncbi:MAG: NADH-quinone oxidoreductase subunit B family protein [Methanoregula sp.]|jgi:Ni,Fe-hydrogenase III small subunit|uniref:NADH-quinone oxidoreductase subunit B family protein n=1 Tax=Methanoregula sp. TaxID=2052170 RepID=UPI0025FBF228|nr:NADH-quinone oxidoreductase subunit B family protein [Methanoregula sp.]MCK9630807.1 NADH-quinone oxidoreductase subunit B family protein [Methanoregula sp.]